MQSYDLRVVIADDEPITKMDLAEILTGVGYKIAAEASDGFDAVEACRKHHPDLVLLDIKMPFLDGLSAAKIIAEENLAGTIMLLTAYSEREFIEKAKVSGVSGYLAVRFFLRLISRVSLNGFAIYVAVLGILVIILQAMGVITDAPAPVAEVAAAAKAVSGL